MLQLSLFEDVKEFDVIITNPPYQQMVKLSNPNKAGTHYSIPIYHKFFYKAIEKAKEVIMIIPARFFQNGANLDNFRDDFINDTRIKRIDYGKKSDEVFKEVYIVGGIVSFYWDQNHNGKRLFDVYNNKIITNKVFIQVLNKVKVEGGFDKMVNTKQSKMVTNVEGKAKRIKDYKDGYFGCVGINDRQKWELGYLNKKDFPNLKTEGNKIGFIRTISSAQGLQKVYYCQDDQVCTDSFRMIYTNNEQESKNIASYMCSRFFNFLFHATKNIKNVNMEMLSNIPHYEEIKDKINWDKDIDEQLYNLYNLTEEEKEYINNYKHVY